MRAVPLTDLVACTGARIVGSSSAAGSSDNGILVNGVSTDTRSVRPGEMYLALQGPNFNGHAFLETALKAGATTLCASDPVRLGAALAAASAGTLRGLLVPDTLAAFQRIAAWYRTTMPAHVFAVTGSVGKTSTRDMVAAALSGERTVHRTAANLNNEIGLPRTLLDTEDGDEVCVLEMGMRAAGEIALLSRIATPDAAAVTNIGTSHIEYLGSREAILAAKLEIVQGLRPDGSLFLNLDDPLLLGFARSLPGNGLLPTTGRRARLVGLRTEDSDVAPIPPACTVSLLARRIRVGKDGTRFDVERTREGRVEVQRDLWIPISGLHAVRNALFGLAAADWAGVSQEASSAGIAGFEPTGSRMKVTDFGRMVLIDDSYNASPESMAAAFSAQRAIADGRRCVAALGGMNELGTHAEDAHRLTGEVAAEAGVALLIATGPYSEALVEGYLRVAGSRGEAICVSGSDALTDEVLDRLRDGDVLLVKGSRSFGMERVARAVSIRFEALKEEER
jgi:UDP-N-acetylmuramoyl-tripeptide--D-alanyl-D-alanine ligase